MLNSIKNFLKKALVRERIVPIIIKSSTDILLSGKTVLVSGGNSGIGYGIAKKLKEAGCKVIISGSNAEKLKEVAKELDFKYIVIDVRNVNEIDNKIKELTRTTNIEILVNSAGFHGNEQLGSVTSNGFDRVFDINVRGLYFMSQAVSNHMKEKGIHGHILNISSASASKPSWTPYEISKRTVDGITLGLADKLIPFGIIVNGIAPGPTATPMLLNKSKTINLKWPGNPSGRMSTVEEVANLALFLVSDYGNGVIGDTFRITGGSGTICIDK